VLLIATVVAGGDTDMLVEDLSQVRLAGEATRRSNVYNAYFLTFQQRSGVIDPTLEQISMWCHADGCAEHFKKVSAAVTRLLCQRGKADLGLEAVFNPFENTL
jgi:sarcosine oxidase delta subunit